MRKNNFELSLRACIQQNSRDYTRSHYNYYKWCHKQSRSSLDRRAIFRWSKKCETTAIQSSLNCIYEILHFNLVGCVMIYALPCVLISVICTISTTTVTTTNKFIPAILFILFLHPKIALLTEFHYFQDIRSNRSSVFI